MQYHPRTMPDLTALAERGHHRQSMSHATTQEQVRDIADLLNPGESTRRDHDHCPAGYDSKRRLWVALDERGQWVNWKCHKCGQQGSLKRQRKLGSRGRKPSSPLIVTSPHNKLGSLAVSYDTGKRVYELSAWPVDLRNWITMYLSPSYIEALGVFYAPYLPVQGSRKTEQRLVLPIYDDRERLAHFAARGSFPKYREVCLREGFKYRGVFAPNRRVGIEPTNVVLVEDWVSAAKVSQVTDEVGVPLWGTSLDLTGFVKQWRWTCKKVIIWLDNDNRIVRQRANELGKQLGTIFQVDVVRGVADPKLCTKAQIKERVQ